MSDEKPCWLDAIPPLDPKKNQDGGVLHLMEIAERDRQRKLLDETEAALDWALSVRASVDRLGRIDSVYRDESGTWLTHEVPPQHIAALERARLRVLHRQLESTAHSG